jgi:excisionase family DNA binding protein
LLWFDDAGEIEPVYSASEVAKICKVSLQTIVRSFDSGDLSGYLATGTRLRRIRRCDLQDFIERHEIPR